MATSKTIKRGEMFKTQNPLITSAYYAYSLAYNERVNTFKTKQAAWVDQWVNAWYLTNDEVFNEACAAFNNDHVTHVDTFNDKQCSWTVIFKEACATFNDDYDKRLAIFRAEQYKWEVLWFQFLAKNYNLDA